MSSRIAGSADSIWLIAAGWMLRLPLARTALVAISSVLLLRAAMAFVPAIWPPENQSLAFIATTSSLCLVMGACFAVGTWTSWSTLSRRGPA